MSKEVLLQQRQRQVNSLQNENDIEDKEEKIIKDNMEQEIVAITSVNLVGTEHNLPA